MKPRDTTAIIAASRHRDKYVAEFKDVVGRREIRVGGRVTRIETPTEIVIFVHLDDLELLRGRNINQLIIDPATLTYAGLNPSEFIHFQDEVNHICARNQLPRVFE